jgi:ABC-type bacteriocin/lantibiotic exporter with double-glycine peptidase domain
MSANEGLPGPQLAVEGSRLSPDVILENVTFTYPASERPAVEDASIRVRAGTSVALVGASGGGKPAPAALALGILSARWTMHKWGS